MKIKVLLFGIATDLLGSSEITLEVPNKINIETFKTHLFKQFPNLKRMSSFALAVNETYATNDVILQENDVVAIIPPVSGG